MNALSAAIRYTLHKLKSKRLHGVHSPFVYAYAEEVLDGINPSVFQILSRKQGRIALSYLKESLLFLKPARVSFSQNIPSIIPDPVIDRDKVEKGGIIFSDALVTDIEDIKSTLTLPDLILVYLPYRNSSLWKELIRSERFNLTMDIWFIGIAIHHPSFLRKQHFNLK